MLVRHLPAESATRTAMRDALTPEQYAQLTAAPAKGHGPWSRTDMLLASIVDLLRVGNYHFAVANGAKNVKPPQPVRRPGVAPAGQQPLTADGRAYLEQIRANRGAGAGPSA